MAWSNYLQTVLTDRPEYISRIHTSFQKVAVAVTQESTQTEHHADRLALAERVINGAGVPTRAHKILHTLNPALQATPEPTDADIEFSVTEHWNYFAGV